MRQNRGMKNIQQNQGVAGEDFKKKEENRNKPNDVDKILLKNKSEKMRS